MAQILKFYDERHQYTLDGEEIPSVSEISRFASREIYGDITQYTLDNACKRGSAVHKYTETLDKYGECEASEDITPYMTAYIQFRKDYGISDYEAIEKSLASRTMKYAGTLDRVGLIDGKRAILDIKTSAAVQNPLAMIQLNGYKKLWEENNPDKPIEILYILHLKGDSKYKLLSFEMDDTLFMACYTLHQALAKKKRNFRKETICDE